MADKPKTKSRAATKSGIFPRPIFEPEARREAPPAPDEPPEFHAETGATTGIMPVVTEGEDSSAERDDDTVTGS
ncbi:MAG: hypothetical protein ACOCXZ_03590 [Chloroflexota bacterium]